MTPAPLLSLDDLQNAIGIKGFPGKAIAAAVYAVLGLGKVDRFYRMRERPKDSSFSETILEDLPLTVDLPDRQLENIPLEGGFITVSNHHFGAVDGLILSAYIGKRRPDYKILTTFFLSLVRNLRGSFIPVNNFSSGKAKSVSGIRVALDHIKSGGGLGLFPAGEVATWQKKGDRTALSDKRVVEDKPWALNMIKLIRRSGLPVVPVYFDGCNSRLFHILGCIHPIFRTLRLPGEMFRMSGKTVKVRIGKPISTSIIASLDDKALGDFLRNATYGLEWQCRTTEAATDQAAPQKPIAPAVDPALVRADVASIENRKAFSAGDYNAYIIKAADAPNLMKELYRLREVTFREIGEGTGNPEDTDSYDSYYNHLILWNTADSEIAGSYRIGYGADIIQNHGGLKGLYTATLIDYGPDAETIMGRAMELGRSFIVAKYQRDVLPLKMMFTGLCVATVSGPPVDRFAGLVSISACIPDFLKSIVVRFLDKGYRFENPDRFARCTNPFKPDYMRVDPDGLLYMDPHDIDALDRLLLALSDNQFRLPVLVRKYFSCGAKAACFNVDPDFSNCLDTMISLDFKDFPEASTRSFVRILEPEMQKTILMKFYGKE